jgi:hypothetical protein
VAKILIGRKLTAAVDSVTATQGPAGAAAWPIKDFTSLVPVEYDELVLSYSGANISTVVYKKLTITVATLTLTYTLGNLTGVVRT